MNEAESIEAQGSGIVCPVCDQTAANIQNAIYISDFGKCLACLEKERGEAF